jgi:hypothetical protein
MYRNEIDTWDYPWTASVWFHNGLTATPNVNLVSNIGFGPDATHTKGNSTMSRRKVSGIATFITANGVTHCLAADRYVFREYFGGKQMVFPYVYFSKFKSFLTTMGLKKFWSW